LNLWIIDPSLNRPEDQGVEEIRSCWIGESRLFRPVLAADGPGPDAGYDFDALVLMGSAASVYDTHDWLTALRDWLRPILAGEVVRPTLGLCFGHQLIGEMAGARVDFLEPSKKKRVGVEETRIDGSRLMPEATHLRVVVSHREAVVETPDHYLVTASRPGVPVDGLEHESLPVFSYQFHPEAREEFAGNAGIDEREIDDRLRADSRRVLDAFLTRAGGGRIQGL